MNQKLYRVSVAVTFNISIRMSLIGSVTVAVNWLDQANAIDTKPNPIHGHDRPNRRCTYQVEAVNAIRVRDARRRVNRTNTASYVHILQEHTHGNIKTEIGQTMIKNPNQNIDNNKKPCLQNLIVPLKSPEASVPLGSETSAVTQCS